MQSYVNNFNHLEFNNDRVQEVMRKLVEPCSADAFIVVNQRGLSLDDLQDPQYFKFLRTYMFKSSSLVSIPRIETPLRLDSVSGMVEKKCRAARVVLKNGEELEDYFDTKKRVIVLDFDELPQDAQLRHTALLQNDQLLRNVIRKLPSPNHVLIYSNFDTHQVLNKLNERRWRKLDIFSDITKDPSRSQEFERNNNRLENAVPHFNEKRTNLLSDFEEEEIVVFDREFLRENENVVLAVLAVAVGVLVWLVYRLFGFLGAVLTRRSRKQPQKEETSKKQR